MREQEAARRQRLAYEKTLYLYSSALERGDLDTTIAILHMAENDPHLEQLLIETHREGYQQEEPAMQPENTHDQVTSLPSGATISGQFQPPPAMPQRPRATSKPRRRWLIALQTTAAVLVVGALLISAFLVFTAHNGSTAHNDTTKQVGDIIVAVSADMTANGIGANGTVTPLNARTAAAYNHHTVLWYVMNGSVTAFNARTHAVLWRHPFDNGYIGDAALVVQDRIVYVAYDKHVLALRLDNGKLLWKTFLGTSPMSAVDTQLAVDHGRVYASGFSNGNLYTLDSRTGTILWHYDAPIPALLTASNGIAYVLANGDDDHNAVKALDGTNGHILWQYNTPLPLAATVANNVLYIQTAHSLANDPDGAHKDQKPLFALNATTGKLRWSTIAPASAPSQLVIAQEMLVLFDGNHFCGYRTKDGSHAWCTTGPTNDINGEGIVSVHGIVYGIYNSSFTGNTVVAINSQNGHLYWSKEIKFGLNLQIIALGDSLILPGSRLVLNRTAGTVLWQLPGPIQHTAGTVLWQISGVILVVAGGH